VIIELWNSAKPNASQFVSGGGTVSGSGLVSHDVEAIPDADAHDLGRDMKLAEAAVIKREQRTRLR
jgi:hypothetical protein